METFSSTFSSRAMFLSFLCSTTAQGSHSFFPRCIQSHLAHLCGQHSNLRRCKNPPRRLASPCIKYFDGRTGFYKA
ncbi:hypothetical protein B0H16DRAFT_540590 [Mycena metata]|uniref:Secreted protein n=1 Tax=Mycena metata TaxID=1033252 RepID=A0AAD7NIG9_9AGAR|nr:hypothetical protein B0H16DRAFT_540590 [Mycena metata]